MNTALQIAAREVRDRGRFFLISAGLACLPFLATLLPSSRGHRLEVIAGFGGFIALVVGLGLAVGLGISTIGSELTSRRLSFWFSKPISPGALWAGKALGSLFSAFACFSIIVGPALVVAAQKAFVLRYGEPWRVPLALFGAFVVLFLVSHMTSTMLRSRSWIIGADLLAMVIAAAVVAYVLRPVVFTPAFTPMMIALGVAFMIVLAVAPYWQLADGRTDIRRSHAALSRAVWTGVAIVLAIAFAVVWWLGSGNPKNFDIIHRVAQTPNGKTAFVEGSAPYRRGLEAAYLLDTATGASDRIAMVPHGTIAASRDGRFAAWIEPTLFRWSRAAIVIRNLSTNESADLGVEVSPVADLVLSDDGSRIAVRDGGVLSIYDGASGNVLAAMSVEPRPRVAFWFVTPDVLRVVAYNGNGVKPARLTIIELDTRTKKRTQIGTAMATPRYNAVSVSGDGSRMYLRGDRVIADGRTGATIATVPSGDESPWASAMLTDGRVVTIERAGAGARLSIYSRDGVQQHQLRLPMPSAWLSGERADGKAIVVGLGPLNAGGKRNASVFLVDLNRGVIERTLANTRGPLPSWSSDPRLAYYDANAKLAAIGPNGKLTYW
jgi:ABC-type transport system involved in multi-copper enzyme maturation permease subunit